MKYIVQILFFLATLTAVHPVASQNNVIDEIVWVVGDEAILKSEVEEYRKEILMQNQRIEGDPYCFIPEQLAVRKLFLDQAKLDSIEVQDVTVNRQLEYLINEYIASTGSVERLEEYYGKKIAGIREDLREQIREQQLVEGVQQKHFGNIQLTPSEIRKYYNSLPQDSLPFIQTTMEVQIITVEPKIPLEEIDKVKARLREYTDQVVSGEREFSTLALLHSEDDASAMKGGELGFMNRSQLVPEFTSVAFALNDPKKVSNVVESEYGFHIIQLIERRGDMGNFRHILLKPRVPQESLDTALVRLDSIRSGIMQQKITFDEAATYLSSDKDTRNNKGIMVNNVARSANGGTPRFALNELNQDIAKIAGEMQQGEISEPFIMLNDKGRQVAAMIRITARNEGHRANINNDYQIIKQMAENARQQQLVDEWLLKKIEQTYVRIDPAWQGCEMKYKGWLK
ncbi:MAG: peptidylprolyl isomerase [Proteiniphilum sp.]|jgi:peptidyl-prolyl cis-trans isomerase SurA|nr:peptidylprolyl isomerase [Proteiniphilum sp.]HHT35492.1 peptidylprolyl isomerase [Bacteroidales bacterium]MDD3331829.1 peptidylprolyl isomerase [Proteiniphilum sp.]MDD3555010.1 peptidylprolyl isomerase [Proteiniphilum sp.]MDD3978586.1 peptidylprolyl isomerase [Proteiniphilum sp.]